MQRGVHQESRSRVPAPRLHTSRMRPQHPPQPPVWLRLHNASLGFTGETVDYVKRGLGGSRAFAIAPQTLLRQLQMALRNGNLVGIYGNLVPERLEVTHLLSLRQIVETWWCLYGTFRHVQMIAKTLAVDN